MLAVLILVWEGVSGNLVNDVIVPHPGDVWTEAKSLLPAAFFPEHLKVTVIETVAGFGLGSAIGLSLAIMLVMFPILRPIFIHYIVAFEAIPKVTLIPVLVTWFGFGLNSKIGLATMLAFFPVFLTATAGMYSVPTADYKLMTSLRANRLQLMYMTQLPHALPALFAGLRLALTMALIGSIVAEFFGADRGLGFLIVLYNQQVLTEKVFVVMIALSLVALALYFLLDIVQRRVVFWAAPEIALAQGTPKPPSRPADGQRRSHLVRRFGNATDWIGSRPWVSRAIQWAFRIALLAILLGIWEGVVAASWVREIIVPPPSAIAQALGEVVTASSFPLDFRTTMYETAAGFGIGMSLGLLLAIVVTLSPLARLLVADYVVGFQAVPKVTLIPILITWFGFGMESKIVLAALISFFPVYITGVVGMRNISADATKLLTSFQANRIQRLWMLQLPSALPTLVAGTKNALTQSLVGAVIAEFFGARDGLGQLIVVYNFSLRIADTFAVIVVLSIVSVLLFYGVELLGKRVVFWQKEA